MITVSHPTIEYNSQLHMTPGLHWTAMPPKKLLTKGEHLIEKLVMY